MQDHRKLIDETRRAISQSMDQIKHICRITSIERDEIERMKAELTRQKALLKALEKSK